MRVIESQIILLIEDDDDDNSGICATSGHYSCGDYIRHTNI